MSIVSRGELEQLPIDVSFDFFIKLIFSYGTPHFEYFSKDITNTCNEINFKIGRQNLESIEKIMGMCCPCDKAQVDEAELKVQRKNKTPKTIMKQPGEDQIEAEKNKPQHIEELQQKQVPAELNVQIEQQIAPAPQAAVYGQPKLGLMNIGNTCYLGTTLHLLYSMEAIKIHLNTRSGQEEGSKGQFSPLIKEMFNLFDSSIENNQQKKNCLKRIGKALQHSLGKRYNQQNDVIEVFDHILNKLIEENQYIEYLTSIRHHKLCDCPEAKQLIYQEVLFKLIDSCQNCGKGPPQYLIVVPNDMGSGVQHLLQLKRKGRRQSQHAVYRNISMANYEGNGECGHYTAYLKDISQWIEVNDSRVRKIQIEPPSPYLCIFEHQKDRQNRPPN